MEDEVVNGERTGCTTSKWVHFQSIFGVQETKIWWKQDNSGNPKMHCALMTRVRTSDLCKAVLEVKPVDGEDWGPNVAGHKQSEWVCWLYPRLLEAFEGLRKAGVKSRSRLLQELAHEFWWVLIQGTMNNLQIPRSGSYWMENKVIAGCTNSSWTLTMLCSCLRGDGWHVVLKNHIK